MSLAAAILQSPVGLEVHRGQLLSRSIWYWTEADGKFRCRWWSAAALADPEGPKIHEHVVPRKQLVLALMELREPTEQSVRGLFEEMAIACVVTRTEDRRLGKATWEELVADPWARYRGTGIDTVDTWAA